MFKVIIAGGEKTNNFTLFKEKCIYYLREKGRSGEGITIYTIGDEFVKDFAAKYGISLQYFFADWKKNGKNALAIRNEDMLSKANALIAFNDESSEMEHLIHQAKNANLPVRVVEYKNK